MKTSLPFPFYDGRIYGFLIIFTNHDHDHKNDLLSELIKTFNNFSKRSNHIGKLRTCYCCSSAFIIHGMAPSKKKVITD